MENMSIEIMLLKIFLTMKLFIYSMYQLGIGRSHEAAVARLKSTLPPFLYCCRGYSGLP